MQHDSRPTFDNPIELEKLPQEPLTFELVALPEEDVPVEPIFRMLLFSFLFVSMGSVAASLFGPLIGINPGTFSLVGGVIGLLLVGWSLLRPLGVVGFGWQWGAALSFLLVLATMMAGVTAERIGWVACGVLLVMATGELTLHWFVLRQRSLNPSVPENPDEPFSPEGFTDAVFPAILLGLAVGHVPVIPGGVITVTLLAGILCALKTAAAEGDEEKNWFDWRRLRYSILHAYAYPKDVLCPGLLRSPLGPRWFRLVPVSLYLALMFVAIVGPGVAILASGNVGPETLVLLVLRVLVWGVIAPALLFIAWSFSVDPLVGRPPVGFSAAQWARQIDSLRESSNPLERSACYHGAVAADGSPVLVDRSLLREHVHLLGDTGGGKTSGLLPLIEQLISFGDSTVIFIDLKGDTHETLASAVAARDRLAARTGTVLPIKYFSLEVGKATHAFNPFASVGWRKMTRHQRTSVLCSACGLYYGANYGRAVFSAYNNSIVYAAEKLRDEERTFSTLHRDLEKIVKGTAAPELPQEVRRSGTHPLEVMGRLASISPLNVTRGEPGFDTAIDLEDCFRNPQLVHFHLPASIAADSSGTVARLVINFLATAAKHVKKRRQVYVVIDEFQRMAAENLSWLLQQARSYDISLVLANQSLEDLGEHGSNLINVVETNCHVRQWFTVSSRNDLKLVELLSGRREKEEISSSVSSDRNGSSVSHTTRMVQVPRVTIDDALYISNQTDLSIMKITGSRLGYAQYRGLPFIVRSPFHITREEYVRRKRFSWPELTDGMIVTAETVPTATAGSKGKSLGWPTPDSEPNGSSDIEISDWSPDGF